MNEFFVDYHNFVIVMEFAEKGNLNNKIRSSKESGDYLEEI